MNPQETGSVDATEAGVHIPDYNVPRHAYGKMSDDEETDATPAASPITSPHQSTAPPPPAVPPRPAARFESLEPPKAILPTLANIPDMWIFRFLILGGSLLSFNAGYINCVAVMTHVRQVVSHVTGHATKAAVELGSEEGSGRNVPGFFLEWALLLSFGFGSSLTGWMIGKEKLTLGQSYGRLLISTGVLVFIAMYSGLALENRGGKAYHSVFILAVVCGMQNAMTTRYSGAVLRTTHLTGMVTDIGLLIGHMMRSDRDFHDLWKLLLFVPIVICFFFGGVSAIPAYNACGLLALWPSVVLLIGGGLSYVMFIARHTNIGFLRALMRPVLRPEVFVRKSMRFGRRGHNSSSSTRRRSKAPSAAYSASSDAGAGAGSKGVESSLRQPEMV